jgi:hypothetical protein
MVSFRVFVFLICFFNLVWQVPVRSEDSPGKAPRAQPENESKSDCEDSEIGSFKVQIRRPDNNIELQLKRGSEVIQRIDPYIDGPGNKCLRMKTYSKSKFVALEVFHGTSGTSVMVERHTLRIYRLDQDRLKFVRELSLSVTENDGFNERILAEKTYKIDEDKSNLKIHIKDKKSKKSEEVVL